jgi:chromosome segregation ATPase
VESENYRRLVLEEADDQAKIDSLEQTIRELSISLQRGSTGGGDAARRLSVLQGEIQQAHAKREAAREAVERIQREP